MSPQVEGRGLFPVDDVRRILWLALPSMAALLTQTLPNIVDTYFFGKLPEHGTDMQEMLIFAIILLWAVAGFLAALSVGTQAMVARRIGEGDLLGAGKVFSNAVVAALVTGIVVAVAGWFAVPAVFELRGGAPTYRALSVSYTQWRFCGLVSLVVTSVYKAYFDATGRTYVHFVASVVMNIVNVVLCWLLIFGNWGAPNMGVAGAGLAAAASSWVGMFVMIAWSASRSDRTRKPYQWSELSASLVGRIAKLSFPSGVATVVVMTGFLLFLYVVFAMDARAIEARVHTERVFGAATTIIIQVLTLIFFACLAFGVATATLVSQSLGEKQPDRAKELTWLSVRLGLILFTTVGVAITIFAEKIVGVFNTSPDVIAAATPSLRLMGGCAPFIAVGMILTQALFGAGNTVYVMVVELTLHFLVLVPGAYLLGVVLDHGLIGVWSAAAVYGALLALAMTIEFRRGAWAKIRI